MNNLIHKLFQIASIFLPHIVIQKRQDKDSSPQLMAERREQSSVDSIQANDKETSPDIKPERWMIVTLFLATLIIFISTSIVCGFAIYKATSWPVVGAEAFLVVGAAASLLARVCHLLHITLIKLLNNKST